MGKLTEGSNTRWESMRMMMPEHREKIREFQYVRSIKTRPEIDEQQLHNIHFVIQESLQNKTEIQLSIFGEINDRIIEGYAVRVSDHQILFQKNDGDEWIRWQDIIEANET